MNGLQAALFLDSFPWLQCPIVDGEYLATCTPQRIKNACLAAQSEHMLADLFRWMLCCVVVR